MSGHAADNADLQAYRRHNHPQSLDLPSFSASTHDSWDVDANDGDTNSQAESSNNSDQGPNMSVNSDGNGIGPAIYSAKSSRYKTAMTTRARQRRLRRMRDTSGGGGGGGGGGDSLASPASGDPCTGGGENSVDDDSQRSSPARELFAGAAPTVSSSPGTPGRPCTPPVSARSKSGGRVVVSPLTPSSLPPTPPSVGSRKVVSPYDESPGVYPMKSPTTAGQERETKRDGGGGGGRSTTSPLSHSRSMQTSIATQEFLPDWKAVNGGWELSPDEVRDAANFTKIQFRCSGRGGEVEMLSGDECDDAYAEANSVCDDSFRGKLSGRISSAAAGKGVGIGTKENGDGVDDDEEDTKQVWQNEVWSDVTTPSFVAKNSNEIFQQKVARGLVSMLSADRMIEAGLMAPEISSREEDEASKDVVGDSPNDVNSGYPSSPDGGLSAVKRNFTFEGDYDPSVSRGGEWQGVNQVTRTHLRDDLDDDVKQSMIFQAFRKNMMEPSPQLSDLLSQINRRGGTLIDRAFATRRKNACGALKILSAKEENKMKICWTVGVLPAIASVLSDVREVEEFDDPIAFAANTEARNRVISTLLNISVNKKNRMLIVNTPGVLDSMTQTILHDAGEGRQGCCTVFLYLAKTAEARIMIVKGAGVMDALANVIKVPKDENPKSHLTRKSKIRRRLIENYKMSPGETTIDTMDTGLSRSRRGRRLCRSLSSKAHSDSDSDSDSDSSHSGSHSSKSGSVSANESTVDESTITSGGVKMVEISFTADTTVAGENESSTDMYDADPNRFLHGARLSVFACLLCLVKSQENSYIIARIAVLIETLLEVSRRHLSPSHSRAIAVLAHLTRHPKNCHQLVFKYVALLTVLQDATGSPDKEARRYAFCALQNLSMDKSCRAPIAHSPKVIWSLTQRCKDTTNEEDESRMAAMATLQNLSDEPANLIQFTIVEDCIGTIIKVARGDSARGEQTDLTSFMAKNTLATLSHWFRKIATSGAERARETEIANASMFGPAGPPNRASSGASPGRPRTFVGLCNATLEPKVYESWS